MIGDTADHQVLLDEINSLKRAIAKQGEMLSRLLQLLEGTTDTTPVVRMSNGISPAGQAEPAAKKTEARPTDEDRFAIGSEEEKGP